MKFKELYEKGLDRKVNPAVSASDVKEETVMTEITEYVFTPDIITNLYNILLNIKLNQGSHVGIWINGYYGSGKSHFLKYVSYCVSGSIEHRELAFQRLMEATNELSRDSEASDILLAKGVSVSGISSLRKWYTESADVDMILFNIGDVHNANVASDITFTSIFWNQFNRLRGYNDTNLAMAQFLEKLLDEEGKFQAFKDYVQQQGYNWENNIARFSGGRLDRALEMAQHVAPGLSIDVIRERISKNQVDVSVESFAKELKEYIDKKQDRNYRILFFVDEVSQFIGTHRDLLLQLQSLVKRLDEVCESKVWIACTAQQTLEEVVSIVGGNSINPEDEVGKILGRFEVRASLQSTSPEYITQKRILDKCPNVEIELCQMYDSDKAKLDAQFILPTTYLAYSSREDFAAYYPFVPYQFQLIMKVLSSFVNMSYVDKQVKDNERSLINITYSIAKETAESEVGDFISFDKFFGVMFQGSLQHLGQRAMENARAAVDLIQDEEKRNFYRRVSHILFMICNLSDVDKQSFSATIDNIVTLLMTRMDQNKATIKNEVSKVLDYFIDKSVIRKVKTETGTEIYEFYTEEESNVAQIIKNMSVDNNTFIEEVFKIISNHFGFTSSSNREPFATRTFTVGANVDGRNYWGNNPDIVVNFLSYSSVVSDSPEQLAFSNNFPHQLIFFLNPQIKADKELQRSFDDYCRVQKFAQEPAVSEVRQRTKEIFQQRAREIYQKEIIPKFYAILDSCPVIAGKQVLSSAELGAVKGRERYRRAMELHLSKLYECARMVDNAQTPKTPGDLSSKILRPAEANLVDMPLTLAEAKVKDYLERQINNVTVADVVKFFAKHPYGWSEIACIYVINELVRRHMYSFCYNNNPNISREDVANNIVRDASRFTIEKAKLIPQAILNDFISAWKQIFNVVTVAGGNDETELFRGCQEKENSALNALLKTYREMYTKITLYPFAPVIKKAIELMEEWKSIREHKAFFEVVIASKDEASKLFDECKNIRQFVDEQFDNYEKIIRFLSDNNDNFNFLSDSARTSLGSLEKIKEDEQPWRSLPPYLKMMKNIDSEIQECRIGFVESIKEKYNKLFDEIDAYAASVHVGKDRYDKRDIVIFQKTNTSNLYALKANLDPGDFYERMLEKINAAIPPQETPSSVDEPDVATGPVATTPQRRRRVIRLSTHTTSPLKSEADVDAYLASLKQEIMAALNDNEDLIIN